MAACLLVFSEFFPLLLRLAVDPAWEIGFPYALVGAEDEGSAFEGDCLEEGEPGVTGVGGGREVEVYVLGVEGVAGKKKRLFFA